MIKTTPKRQADSLYKANASHPQREKGNVQPGLCKYLIIGYSCLLYFLHLWRGDALHVSSQDVDTHYHMRIHALLHHPPVHRQKILNSQRKTVRKAIARMLYLPPIPQRCDHQRNTRIRQQCVNGRHRQSEDMNFGRIWDNEFIFTNWKNEVPGRRVSVLRAFFLSLLAVRQLYY